MGTRIVHHRYDDLDETVTDDVQEVQFGFEGKTYSIDLGAAHRKQLEESLAPFIRAAHIQKQPGKVTRPKGTSPARRGKGKAIREWAAANNITMNPRGAIPKDIERQYDAANPA